jgi:hypothetical protein
MVQALLAGRKTVTRRMSRQWLKLQVGDVLWVRETFLWLTGNGIRPWFRADGEQPMSSCGQTALGRTVWIPAIHMPRHASRITLRMTEPPRLERAWDITEADAKLEGVTPEHNAFEDSPNRVAFFRIWQQLHTKPGERWSDNPEVVRIAFEKVAT